MTSEATIAPGPAAGPMLVVHSVAEVRAAVAAARRNGRSVGLVPTMGAMHAGHRSLMRAAKQECGFIVVSIFVNRAQFTPSEDFSRYPRPLEQDLDACRQEGVDLTFVPPDEVMYRAGYSSWLRVEGLDNVLEGEFRPGHFRGVATVVLHLLNLVTPDRAYFGEKDYQQLLVIRKMVQDLDVPVDVRACPIVREPDGLACSSRNQYLQGEDRARAAVLFQALTLARDMIHAGERDVGEIRQRMRDLIESTEHCTLEYAELVSPDTLELATSLELPVLAVVAARVGGTRLIDNLQIDLPGSET